MKKHFWILAALPILIAIISCSSDDSSSNSNNNPTSGNYLPLAVGNYWVYENREIDSNNVVSSAIDGYDSTVIVQSGTYFGKSAYKALTYHLNPNFQIINFDTAYYAKDGNKFYVYATNSMIPIDLSGVTLGWIKMSDFDASSAWNLMDTSLTGFSMPFPGVSSATLNLKISASNGAKSNILTPLKTFSDCNQSVLNVKPIMSLKIDTNGISGTVNIEYNMNSRVYYCENIGPVKQMADPQGKPTLTSPDINSFIFAGLKILIEPQIAGLLPKTPGNQSLLIRYKVN